MKRLVAIGMPALLAACASTQPEGPATNLIPIEPAPPVQIVEKTVPVLLAPEVVRMEVRYFNGSEIGESWDMKELKSLPVAVEVRIWLRSPNSTNARRCARRSIRACRRTRRVTTSSSRSRRSS